MANQHQKLNSASRESRRLPDDRPLDNADAAVFTPFTTLTVTAAARQLDTDPVRGLTQPAVEQRLASQGRNEIELSAIRWPKIFFRQFRSSFVYLLVAAAGVAYLLGELIDGSMILLFVVINAVLGFLQEYHSEKAVRQLRRFTVRTAKARRSDEVRPIPVAELVPGDVVLLESGDILPADCRFTMTQNLALDESVLTGESAPVNKTAEPLTAPSVDLYQAANIGFSGTSVVGGRAEAVIIATGSRTVFGHLASLTGKTLRVSAFEKGINRFSAFILRLISGTLVLLFAVNLLLKAGHISVAELAIFSVALAVSVIPEALPVVTTFSLSRGALRLAKNHVVVKRLAAIEDLGSIEILCTDKTGTLTENTLTVAEIFGTDPDNVLRLAALASSDPSAHAKREANNAFDLAVWDKLTAEQRTELSGYRTVAAMPFDPERRRNSRLVRLGEKNTLIVRGAAEVIAGFIDQPEADARRASDWARDQGLAGRRVIAVAAKELPGLTQYGPEQEQTGLRLAGYIAFADPVKQSTKAAVDQARRLGVRIKILTGDSREVAQAVARQIGLIKTDAEVITGQELAQLPPTEQLALAERASVFARVSPGQKYQIIRLLQHRHEVGFLGEGINDAPALKIANVGLVVDGAADIAREAADIVLLRQSLEVIVDGIREGREVFSNTIKYLKVTLASNFGNFYAIAIASLLIDFLPMLPLQLLLVNLLSDFPMIAIAADSTDAVELRRPKTYDVREVALVASILGAVSSLFDFIIFSAFLKLGPTELHTYWFIGSILTELVLIFSLRSRLPFFRASRPSGTVFSLALIAAGLTVLLPFIGWSRAIFQFAVPAWPQLGLVGGIVAAYFVVTECAKLLYYRFHLKELPAEPRNS